MKIETGRYTKPVTPSDQRSCKYCKHLVEDEIHFLFQCPQYSSIRSKFGIYEKVLALTDILDEEMIKTINPVSAKDLKSICMYSVHTSFRYRYMRPPCCKSFSMIQSLCLFISSMLMMYCNCMFVVWITPLLCSFQ